MEPRILKLGKEFHLRVLADWGASTKDGRLSVEHTIKLSRRKKGVTHAKRGRVDIFVDELGSLVSVIEIKSTDWDHVKSQNVSKLLSSHCRQVCKYVEEYADTQKTDVCPVIIYPRAPCSERRKEQVEAALNGNGIQVVWYDEC